MMGTDFGSRGTAHIILVVGCIAVGKTATVERYTTNYFSSKYRATIGFDTSKRCVCVHRAKIYRTSSSSLEEDADGEKEKKNGESCNQEDDSLVSLTIDPLCCVECSSTTCAPFSTHINHRKLCVQLWHLAGNMLDKSVIIYPLFLRASGIIVMFDATRFSTTFSEARRWVDWIARTSAATSRPRVPVVLVANKCDLTTLTADQRSTALLECARYAHEKMGEIEKFFEISAKTGDNVHESIDYLLVAIEKLRLLRLAAETAAAANQETPHQKKMRRREIRIAEKENAAFRLSELNTINELTFDQRCDC